MFTRRYPNVATEQPVCPECDLRRHHCNYVDQAGLRASSSEECPFETFRFVRFTDVLSKRWIRGERTRFGRHVQPRAAPVQKTDTGSTGACLHFYVSN